ncbi:MAG: hypothetical protein EXR77_14995 [Myxococcales bacterium]|nr:hypothetical protein [Myxococcales bacterium]
MMQLFFGLAVTLAVNVYAQGDAAPATAAPRASASLLAALAAVPADPAPAVLRNVDAKSVGEHYWVCNEKHLELFQPTVFNAKGLLLGVGTDQMYTLAGWQDPDILLLTDYDPWVVHLHQAYFALVRAADTPKKFIALWSPTQRATSLHLLQPPPSTNSGEKSEALTQRLFRQAGGQVYYHLLQVQQRMRSAKVPCWLTDQAQYDRVRALVREGRAIALQADWTRRGAMPTVAQVLKQHGQMVRVAYLSNAEDYLQPYPPEFRAIVRALPVDAQSWWLRTQATGKSSIDLRYNIQRLQNFANWLAHPQVKLSRQIVVRLPTSSYDQVQFAETKGAQPPAWLIGKAKLP